MIKITNKEDCCGCAACEQSCPKHCISLIEDAEGFWYPQIDNYLYRMWIVQEGLSNAKQQR